MFSFQLIGGGILRAGLGEPLLLQLRAKENPERQAEIRVFEIAAEQLRDMGEPV